MYVKEENFCLLKGGKNFLRQLLTRTNIFKVKNFELSVVVVLRNFFPRTNVTTVFNVFDNGWTIR